MSYRLRVISVSAFVMLLIATLGLSGARADQTPQFGVRGMILKPTVTPTDEPPVIDTTGGSDSGTDNSGDTATTTPDLGATPEVTPDLSGGLVDGGFLALDEPVSGKLDADHFLFGYLYTATKGEAVTLTLKAGKGLNAVVRIAGSGALANVKFAKGKTPLVLQVSGGKTGTLDITFPSEGDYALVVSADEKTPTGTFTLTLSASGNSGTGGDSTEDTGNFPDTIDVTGTARTVISRLQKAQLVPTGGKQVMTVDNSFGRTSDPGLSYLTLGRGLQVQDLVLNFQVSWNQAGDSSGCGFQFRNDNGTNYSIVLLTNDGKVELFQSEDKKTKLDYFKPSDLFKPGSPAVVTLIAVQDQLAVYINGQRQTVQTSKSTLVTGGFAIEVFNADDNKVLTDCRYRSIWVWSFD